MGSSDSFDPHTFSVDASETDSAVDVSPIVADLEAITLPGLDEVDVLESP